MSTSATLSNGYEYGDVSKSSTLSKGWIYGYADFLLGGFEYKKMDSLSLGFEYIKAQRPKFFTFMID